MSTTLGIVLLIVLAVVWLVVRRRDGGTSKARPAPAKRTLGATSATPDSDTSEFHAVSIKALASSCQAAKLIQGKRYLSNAAPKLPLDGCDAATCKCRFVHHEDRRTGDDRRNPYGGNIGIDPGVHDQERRKPRDRRARPPKAGL
jgi:hypothetical protein